MFCTLTLQTHLVHFAGGENCAVFSPVKFASDMIGRSTGRSLGSYLLHWNVFKNIFWFSLSPRNPNTGRWEDNILLKEAAVRKVPHSWQFLKDSRGRILIQKSFWQVLEESESPWSIKKVISTYCWPFHYQDTEYLLHNILRLLLTFVLLLGLLWCWKTEFCSEKLWVSGDDEGEEGTR